MTLVVRYSPIPLRPGVQIDATDIANN